MQAKEWTVAVYITEDGDNTYARAVLSTPDRTSVTGTGRARRNPKDVPVPEIGDELAAGRALSDLAHRLLELAAEDVAQFVSRA